MEPLEHRLVLDSTVVFNEIMYHDTDQTDSEWIELYNQMTIDMDISRWRLEGGVNYRFAEGTTVPGRGYLVVPIDPLQPVQATSAGFTGRLANDGEELRLVNNDNRTMNVLNYNDAGRWPVGPDGSGFTLAKRDPMTATADADHWTVSQQRGGTPGTLNFINDDTPSTFTTSTLLASGAPVTALVPSNDSLGSSWISPTFNDASWLTGTTGVGYESSSGFESLLGLDLDDPPNAQTPQPMNGVNATVYVRVDFQVSSDPNQYDAIALKMKYDDGFVAYLNGTEVARMAAPDTLSYNSGAEEGHNDNLAVLFQDFDITGFTNLLVQGSTNVLAIHGLNFGTTSSDMLLIPEIEGRHFDITTGGTSSETIIAEGDDTRVFIPTNGSLGQTWTTASFDDSSWLQGPTAVGFDSGSANVVAYGNLAGASGSSAFSGALGHDFTVNSAIQVTHLGVFDSGADGLARTLTAELWTRNGNTGTELAELVFTTTSPGTLINSNRVKPLTAPLDLAPGDYTIVAHGYGASERAGSESLGGPDSSFKTLNDGGGALTFVDSRLGATAGAFPNVPEPSSSVNRFSAATFQFTNSSLSGKVATDVLANMHHVNASAYLRTDFVGIDPMSLFSATLDVTYNDGFVAYLNGVEVARRNAPTSVQWNSSATTTVALGQAQIDLALFLNNFVSGNNVLAIQGLNVNADDTTFFVTPTLEIKRTFSARPLVLNEIPGATQSGFWIEIANEGTTSIPIGGYVIASSAAPDNAYVLPAQIISAGGQTVVNQAELGFGGDDGDRIFLYLPGKNQLIDARRVTGSLRGRSAQHDGQWLYPDAPTPGATNSFTFNDQVVINEIMYHPPGELSGSTPAESSLSSAPGVDPGSSVSFVAYGNLTGANGTSDFAGALGHDFTANSEITVSHLGVFDSGANGLSRTLTAELWSRSGNSGTKLAQLVFTAGDPGVLIASNRLKALASPLELSSGNYTIVAHGYGSQEKGGSESVGGPSSAFKTLDDGGGLISFVDSRLGVNAGAFPSVPEPSSSVNRFSAGTFQFTGFVPTVPNPPDDWLELYNHSETAVDLTNWTLSGGIGFDFAEGTTIAAGDYLVVARDIQQLAGTFPDINVVGNMSGRLRNSTDRIELVDANKNPVDEVEYFDGGRWPGQADGGGSSLELRDVDADNTKGEAWAASNASLNSSWKSYSARHVAANDSGPTLWHELVLGLLDTGQVLVDDVSVRQDPDGANIELIQNGTFESDGIGSQATKWRIIGNHHGTVIDDPDNPGTNKVLQLVADAHARHEHDHAETTFVGNVSIQNGTTYEISLRAKWLGGSSLLNARLYWNRAAETFVLEQPDQLGTPGTVNSALESNIGPTYSGLSHTPVKPTNQQPVTVEVMAEDPDSVSSMTLFWSTDRLGTFREDPMSHQGGGRYQGTISGQSSGTVVQFYVQGQDTLGANSTFPAAGADSRALYQVDNGKGTSLAVDTIRLITIPSESAGLSTNAELLSNKFIGATLTVNDQEVFYDVKMRRKGGVFHQRPHAFRVNLNADDLFRGVHDRIALDGTGAGNILAGSQDEILTKQLLNHAGGIVSMYDDLAYMIAPDSGPIILNLARYDSVYLDEQFANGNESPLYEFEAIGYWTSTVSGGPEGLKNNRARGFIQCCDLTDFGTDKEDYRWRFNKKNAREQDDFQRIIEANQAFSLSGNELQAAVNEILDIDQWMRQFAMMSLLGVLDVYSVVSYQNVMMYVRPEDNKVLIFPWDWDQAWAIPTNDPLHRTVHPHITKVLDLPLNERLHLGHMHDIINTTFNRTYATDWAQHLGGLIGQNYGVHLGYITDRSNSVLSQFPAQIPFGITTGETLNVGNAATATIGGNGWVNVREIQLQNGTGPLDVSWSVGNGSSFADTWEVTVPVTGGTHTISLQAYDYQGALIGSDSIHVTSTTPNPIVESLRITEINYNPSEPTAAELAQYPQLNNDDFEFLEFQNIGSETINLLGTSFTDGLQFVFPNRQLAPGQRGVVVRDTTAFQVRYGSTPNVLGEFTSGSLSNAGEKLTLVDGQLQAVLDFSYDDNNPWPERADGTGGTLELIDPAVTPVTELGKHYRWRGSTMFDGSPGSTDADPPGIVINEVLAHTDPPVTQSDSIELYNPTSSPINISGWWLSDSAANLLKYEISNSTILDPGEFMVFNESHFNPTPSNPGLHHFALSGASGDEVWLVVANGNGNVQLFVDDVHFGASPNGESFGRAPHGSGRIQPMLTTTFNGHNADPRVGPLVISEVNYHPASPSAAALAIESTLTDNDLEFIEILNPTAEQLDLTNWRIRGEVDFDFTAATTIGAGSTLVVVAFDPDSTGNSNRVMAFRAHYGIGAEVQIVGGYQNQLGNGSARVQLQRPDAPPLEQPTLIPRLFEDEILYDDLAPWSPAADGMGMSLHRADTGSAASEAASWTPRAPNPGQPQHLGDADLDGDVDTSDLTTAIINFTSANGTGKTWTDGDTDGDGDVDTSDLTTAIINFSGAASDHRVSFILSVNSSQGANSTKAQPDNTLWKWNGIAVSNEDTRAANGPEFVPHAGPRMNLSVSHSKTDPLDAVLENWAFAGTDKIIFEKG